MIQFRNKLWQYSLKWQFKAQKMKYSLSSTIWKKKALLYTDDNKSTCQVLSRVPKGKHCSYFPSFLEFVGWGLVRYPVSIHWELTPYVWSSLIGGLLNIRSNSFLSLDACNDKKNRNIPTITLLALEMRGGDVCYVNISIPADCKICHASDRNRATSSPEKQKRSEGSIISVAGMWNIHACDTRIFIPATEDKKRCKWK